MQFLYVLTSSYNDYYYEQFLLSLTSLRNLMPNAEVILLCDTKTKATLNGRRSEYEKLVSKITTAVAPSMSQIEISRWLKTSMRRLIQGDFLFIDCDTIIADDLTSISEMNIQFGACSDKHSKINRHSKCKNIIKNDKKLGFTSYLSNRHNNSGVIFCADTPEMHKIFNRWHDLWVFSNRKKVVRDQPSFNQVIYENSSLFTELDGTWNCQIAFNGLPYLANSKIIHYFATDLFLHISPFSLASDEIFKKIKETGTIPEQALELLKNPRAAFVPESRIIAGDTMLSVINSSWFEATYTIKQKIPFLFSFVNGICSIMKKIGKFFIVRKSRKKDSGIKYYN